MSRPKIKAMPVNGLASSYQELDINQRINLRAMVLKWLEITQERFQESQDKIVYGRKRSSRKRPLRRSNRLRTDWRHNLNALGDDVKSASLSFLLYGRFVDMGVGKGTDIATSKYQSVRKNGEKRTRRPAKWYSKRKSYETHRLRELLAQHYITIPLETMENALSTSVGIHV